MTRKLNQGKSILPINNIKGNYSRWIDSEEIGGADGIRTHDLLDAIEARSQLRHGPTFEKTQQKLL